MSHITYVLCDCADINFVNSKKKNNQEISLNQKTFLWPYSNAHICLIQRNFIWIKRKNFWVYSTITLQKKFFTNQSNYFCNYFKHKTSSIKTIKTNIFSAIIQWTKYYSNWLKYFHKKKYKFPKKIPEEFD